LLVQSNLRRRTRYAVTDQLVLFRTNTGLDAISLATLPSMATHKRGDGGGSITFGDAFEFMDVPEVKEVYQLIVTELDRRRRVT
jgi:hypothetical protein